MYGCTTKKFRKRNEKNHFAVARKRIKYLGINLTKYEKALHIEDYNAVLKEI